MNRNKLKTYAPLARREFIRVVTDRAAFYGLTEKMIQPLTEQDDVTVIGGQAFPKSVAAKRKRLEQRITRDGFQQTMEAMAYTWFNRFVAIRYMELHGYLDHGYRVLSPSPQWGEGWGEGATPEIIEHAEHVDLPGIDRQTVVDMKLDGDQEPELYRMLLLAQCHALYRAMPFLFEPIDDETELLLPDNLLHSDSPIRKLVASIDEDDWQEVEIIGWLYQFYISEKKDQVIGKVVKSEDIPAATQLFTPNWIVKYLVQNSLGRLWMEHHPDSQLRAQMEYYIEPAEQTPEVQAQLQEIIRQRVEEHRGGNLATDERGEFLATDQHGLNTDKENAGDPCFVRVSSVADVSLDPEKLTLLDPACGSGHILVEAYDLLKAIYQERGYRARDIPRLILEKNLYGLEIDDRAAQLAAFALMMKARADDRRIFDAEVKLNVMAIQDSKGLDVRRITEALNQPIFQGETSLPKSFSDEIDDANAPLFRQRNLAVTTAVAQADIAELIDLFQHGKTFGSLIRVTEKLERAIPVVAERIESVLSRGGMFERETARSIKPLVKQARILAHEYKAVVTNPPYMGSNFFSPRLKAYVKSEYPKERYDLYACFLCRNMSSATSTGFVAMITIPNWMFLSSFEDTRRSLLTHQTIDTFIQNGRGVFGSDFGSCSFVVRNHSIPSFRGRFRRLFDKQGSVATNEKLEGRFHAAKNYSPSNLDFFLIPGCPIVFTLSHSWLTAFANLPSLNNVAAICAGLSTGDNAIFQRQWFEIDFSDIALDVVNRNQLRSHSQKWVPCNSGGDFRKWYGNQEVVVDWEADGAKIRSFGAAEGRVRSAIRNEERYGQHGVTWSKISIGAFAARYVPPGFIFDDTGRMLFPHNISNAKLVGWLCSRVVSELLTVLAPSTSFTSGDLAKLPVVNSFPEDAERLASEAIAISKADWDSKETSWGFQMLPVCRNTVRTIQDSQKRADADHHVAFCRMKELEEGNNRLFIEAYRLENELSFEVPEDQITLYRPDREEDIKRLISYAIGCMMGRYRLDRPGLIYAHSGNRDFHAIYYGATEEHGLNTDTKDPSDPCSIRVPSVANSPCSFPPDDDGIIPITDTDWFPDDATNRLVEFIATAWPGGEDSRQKAVDSGQKAADGEDQSTAYRLPPTAYHLEENLVFIAESLGPKKGETSRDTIRRYLSQGFFKHHLSMYKRRPIYWKFTSGKQRAFECLVYLHRYNEGTLPRMRTEYVIPLLGRIEARIEQLKDDIAAATSTAHGKRLQKERDKLIKQQAELQKFDEKLRHYADRRIQLDLDDGVKVNYAKFGDLLAEVKSVTGKA